MEGGGVGVEEETNFFLIIQQVTTQLLTIESVSNHYGGG